MFNKTIGVLVLGIFFSVQSASAATVPNKPEQLTAFPLSPTSLVVKWADSSDIVNPAQSFSVEISTNGVNFNPTIIPATSRNFTYNGLTAGGLYYLRVNAVNSTGSSAYTPTIEVRTAGFLRAMTEAKTGNIEVFPLKIEANSGGERVILGRSGESAYFVSKYNTAGALMWEHTLPGEARDIAMNTSGQVAVTGMITEVGEDKTLYRMFIQKYESNGVLAWSNIETDLSSMGIPSESIYGNAVVISETGLVTVTGGSNGLDNGYGDGDFDVHAFIFDYTANGTIHEKEAMSGVVHVPWVGDENQIRKAEGTDLAIDSNGIIYMIGNRTDHLSKGQGDILSHEVFVRRLKNSVWTRNLGGSFDREARIEALELDHDNNLEFLYSIDASGAGNSKIVKRFLTKFDPNGATMPGFPVLLGTNTDGTFNESSTDIEIDSINNIYLFGAEHGKYSSTGQLLGEIFAGVSPTPPSFNDIDIIGSDIYVLGSDSPMYVAKYADTETFIINENIPPTDSAVSINCTGGGISCTTVNVNAISTDAVLMRFSANSHAWSEPMAFNAHSTFNLGLQYVLYAQFQDALGNWTSTVLAPSREPAGPIPQYFSDWRFLKFASFTSAESAENADPDNDGVTNLYEYLFNTDPMVPTGSGITSSVVNGRHRYTARVNPRTVDYSITTQRFVPFVNGVCPLDMNILGNGCGGWGYAFRRSISTTPGVGYVTIVTEDYSTIAELGGSPQYRFQVEGIMGPMIYPPRMFGTALLDIDIEGAGRVTSATGIDCNTDCNKLINADTPLPLLATPAAGFTFSGWSENCSGSNNCSVTTSNEAHVTASFVPVIIPPPITPPSVTIIAPNGGEIFNTSSNAYLVGSSNSYAIGPTFSQSSSAYLIGPFPNASSNAYINWQAAGLTDYAVEISLFFSKFGENPLKYVITSNASNTGGYNWMIPGAFRGAIGMFEVVLRGRGVDLGKIVSDRSNSYFNIVN